MKKINSFVVLTALLFIFSQGFAAEDVSYSQENVSKYANFDIQGTSWLSFRDIPEFVERYVHGKRTLDFGCGTGRSTRFLRSLGFDATGVDISEKYINEASKIDDSAQFFLVESGKIPVVDNSYDFVFSSHVLLMMPSRNELNRAFKEINRILKDEGIFIAITGSEEMHSPKRNWLSYETNFAENNNPKRGSRVKLIIKDVGATFYDYNWTDDDYREALTANGFEVLETHFPLGKDNEKYEWDSEKEASPYIVYVAKKKSLPNSQHFENEGKHNFFTKLFAKRHVNVEHISSET